MLQGDQLHSRRSFLKILGKSSSVLCLTPINFGKATQLFEDHLDLYNIHTGESFKGGFRYGEEYDTSALEELDQLLRDHHSGDSIPTNTQLLLLVSELQSRLKLKASFDVISGYRSAKTNEKLRRQGRGVAKNSYHKRAMAIDIKSRRLTTVRDCARLLRRGGVGYYSASKFVHVDVRCQIPGVMPVYWQR